LRIEVAHLDTTAMAVERGARLPRRNLGDARHAGLRHLPGLVIGLAVSA
jgi:hypothetical protein